ncbi:ABC transporter ATP-binding protein [Pseudomonas sp. H11T01]|uniref:ABC transporter ATP-binding protein n=1 Tax=Pseudomonas sp. H11T01 TaxID=3402749 RepID=UPI003ABF6D9D
MPAAYVSASSDIAIRVKNLSKCFQIYEKPSDRLLQMLARGFKQFYREFWALKDISFEVKKGETVGIVGRNGSGKSTLLQLICGTLNPSSGDVEVKGRIAALLELGSGFNPEFTGRENVYMNAAVLGLKKHEVDARYAEIESFADIGQFIDQPVKTYSSGMTVRLAFAVAINADPEILIIDEALSVGDELFQRKCFSRIEAIKKNGTTILFVSHSGAAVVGLCDRAILIDSGEALASGPPKKIIGKYQRLLYAPSDKRASIRDEIRLPHEESLSVSTIGAALREDNRSEVTAFFDPNLNPKSTLVYESLGALIEIPVIHNFEGKQVNCLKRGETYRYCYKVRFEQAATNVRFGMLIKTTQGFELGGGVSAHNIQDAIPFVEVGAEYEVAFSFICALNPAMYFLNAGVVGIVGTEETYLHRVLDACMFRVLPDEISLSTGVVDFRCESSFSTVMCGQGKVLV